MSFLYSIQQVATPAVYGLFGALVVAWFVLHLLPKRSEALLVGGSVVATLTSAYILTLLVGAL